MQTKIYFTTDNINVAHFYPFSFTKAIEDFPIGIFTNRERWERVLKLESIPVEYNPFKKQSLSQLIKNNKEIDYFLLIKANVLPTKGLIKLIKKLKVGDAVSYQNTIIAQLVSKNEKAAINHIVQISDALLIQNSHSITAQISKACILLDIDILKPKVKKLPPNITATSSKNIYIDEEAQIGFCFMNTDDGPIYIGKNAKVLDGAMLRGPLVLNENALIKMGATIYGATIIGKNCTVGGEIKNSVLFEHSNKAHDGYLGDAIIAEWCNLGAGTICSNVKNTAAPIQFELDKEMITVAKAGVHMGAYSKTAINTAINTGTTIGVGANVFGNGLTPKKIDNFSWGMDGHEKYQLEKLYEHIDNWKKFKGLSISETEKIVLKKIYLNK